MEEIITNENLIKEVVTVPMIALRGKVLLPKTFLSFDVGRAMSLKAIDKAREIKSNIFIASQKNAFQDNPKKEDVFEVGVVARIKQIVKGSNNSVKVQVEGLYRAKIIEYVNTNDMFSVIVERSDYTSSNAIETEALFRLAKNKIFEYSLLDKHLTKEVLIPLTDIEEANEFIDNSLNVLSLKEKDCQEILETTDTVERLTKFVTLLTNELEILKVEKKISNKVRENIDKSQKEYYLREQIKAIHTELGDDEDEKEKIKEDLRKKNLPKEVWEKAIAEINRLDKINPSSPDYSIILNYLDWIKQLPFNEVTTDTESLVEAKEILDSDHFGLEKVKQRITEYIAVLKLTKKLKGPILCFVGPPGVGRTSVAKSIARALNRNFVRMSLGGVKDESEIRGHRRTYVGAMPGRIITGLKNAKSANPVFLLDEIDKLSSDIHGDPASALLEVLDPEQNTTFRDRYMDIPYDLSKVIFITTANSLETIPYPLLDRMEVIELTGYTNEEKLEIAKRYLIPKALENNGLKSKNLTIKEDAVKEIIEGYTLEAGVRNLEREINSVVRKVATKFAEDATTKKQVIGKTSVGKYLGIKKRQRDLALTEDEVGAATGLAWTAFGGTTLTIEIGLMAGKGDIILTGKLGDVMKESARAAISYIRANAEKYNISEDRFSQTDIHIHVPEGATPKDGPSAGITMATAILSAFTKKPVRKKVAMTGEITLRGKVLPIGGLKEKSLAAFRMGITDVIIPKENQKDLLEIPNEIKEKLNFIPVSNVEKVFEVAFGENKW